MNKSTLLIASAFLLVSCAGVNTQQAATILAKDIQVAQPFVSNTKLSNILYGVQVVAQAYGNTPVPSNILQTTAILPGVAQQLAPLVSSSNNNAKTQAVITAAAQILANTNGAVSTASSTSAQ